MREPQPVIKPLADVPDVRAALADILIEAVAGGGSVSFMHPLPPEQAAAFWHTAFVAAARNERIILGAWAGESLAGTVTLLLDTPPNQPHRAEIAKLMVRLSHRGQGIAATLMRAAEAHAAAQNRTLLVLDTATDGGAKGLYDGLGYTLSGEIPDYALKPHGGFTGTLIYWKRLSQSAGAGRISCPPALAQPAPEQGG
jgi:ribosomal protein S18 acetylase RimI-like enzyme